MVAVPEAAVDTSLDATAVRADPGVSRTTLIASLSTFVVFRVAIEAVALLAAYGTGFPRLLRHAPHIVSDVWYQWDAQWYGTIAEQGYGHTSLVDASGRFQDAAAFPPLLPALMHAVGTVLHVGAPGSGFLVTAAALLAALVGLHRLASRDLGRDGASLCLTLLVVFPSAFFLAAGYSEALALALAVWSMEAARADRWWLAGVLGALAGVAKLYLVILVVPLVIEAAWLGHDQSGRQRWRRPPIGTAWVGVVPLGLVAWAGYLWSTKGSPFVFATAQKGWGRALTAPWHSVGTAIGDFASLRMFDHTDAVVRLLDLGSVGLAVACAVYAWRRLRPAYAALIAVALLVNVSTPELLSVTREMLVVFPIFVVMAAVALRRAWLERLTIATSAPLCAYLCSHFVTRLWAG